jgi:acyl carrier protein
MNNTRDRVASCFAIVFPDVAPGEIPGASSASLAAWDSVAHITLLASISEEFGVEFSPEDYEELTSFSRIADYLERHADHA